MGSNPTLSASLPACSYRRRGREDATDAKEPEVRGSDREPEERIGWFLDFYELISKGPSGLSRVEREMIGVVVSGENRCVF